MAETTENSLRVTPKLVHKLHKTNPSRVKSNIFSSLKAIDNINNRLTRKQRLMFQDTCFGHFLSLGSHSLQFSAQLVHQLLLREVESPNPNEMWILVGEKTIRFSMQEFCIVTGLDCSPCPRIDVTKVEGVRLIHEFFRGSMNLHNNDLEAAFLRVTSNNDEAMVKLALLYCLETVLLGRENKSPIDIEHILLVDDLQQFKKYPWGRLCFDMTMKSLKEALQDQKSKGMCPVYNLTGFPYAFQVWAFEAISSDIQDVAFKHSCALPRINNWWSTTKPSLKTVQEFFRQKNVRVHTVLEITEEEKRQEYLRQFISSAYREVPLTNTQEDESQVVRADTMELNPAIAKQSKDELSTPEQFCASKIKREIEEPEAVITEFYPESATNIMAKKRKLPVEVPSVEKPCLEPEKRTMKHLDQQDMCHYREAPMPPSSLNQAATSPEHIPSSSSSKPRSQLMNMTCNGDDQANQLCHEEALRTKNKEAPAEAALELSAEVEEPSLAPTKCTETSPDGGPSSLSRLGEEHVLFARIKSMLDRSTQDFLQSSQSVIVTPEQINQAKHILQPVYSMKFEQLAHPSQRDQVESSIELLLEAGHFPPCTVDMIRSFHKNFITNIEKHSNCRERINRFDKNKQESEVHREELAKQHSRFDHIVQEIAIETEEIEKLTKELEKKRKSVILKEAEAKDLAVSSTSSADALTRCMLKLKTLEKEKQNAEKDKAEIEEFWEEFKRKTRKYM